MSLQLGLSALSLSEDPIDAEDDGPEGDTDAAVVTADLLAPWRPTREDPFDLRKAGHLVRRTSVGASLEERERMVRRIRLRLPETLPAHVAARPVTPARILAAREFRILDRCCGFPLALVIAVVGDAGCRADARACQHRDRTIVTEKMTECAHCAAQK